LHWKYWWIDFKVTEACEMDEYNKYLCHTLYSKLHVHIHVPGEAFGAESSLSSSMITTSSFPSTDWGAIAYTFLAVDFQNDRPVELKKIVSNTDLFMKQHTNLATYF